MSLKAAAQDFLGIVYTAHADISCLFESGKCPVVHACEEMKREFIILKEQERVKGKPGFHLFLGGPADGKWANPGSPPGAPAIVKTMGKLQPPYAAIQEIKEDIYNPQQFQSGSARIVIYIHDRLAQEELIGMLVKGYNPCS